MAAREMKKQDTEEKAVHEMTAAEHAAIERHFARCEATPSIRCKVSGNGSDLQIELDHPDEQTGHALMMDALASADGCFVSGIVSQLANVEQGQDIDERGLNFMLSVIKGIEPRDQLEAMLAARWRRST